MAVALANIFGGNSGLALAMTDDTDMSMLISASAAKGQELVFEMLDYLARAIRNEITDAWNKGRENAG